MILPDTSLGDAVKHQTPNIQPNVTNSLSHAMSLLLLDQADASLSSVSALFGVYSSIPTGTVWWYPQLRNNNVATGQDLLRLYFPRIPGM